MIIWCWSGIWGTGGNQISRTCIHDFAYIYVLCDSALQHLSALNSSDAWNHITSYPWLLSGLAVQCTYFVVWRSFLLQKAPPLSGNQYCKANSISHPICFHFYRGICTCSQFFRIRWFVQYVHEETRSQKSFCLPASNFAGKLSQKTWTKKSKKYSLTLLKHYKYMEFAKTRKQKVTWMCYKFQKGMKNTNTMKWYEISHNKWSWKVNWGKFDIKDCIL